MVIFGTKIALSGCLNALLSILRAIRLKWSLSSLKTAIFTSPSQFFLGGGQGHGGGAKKVDGADPPSPRPVMAMVWTKKAKKVMF